MSAPLIGDAMRVIGTDQFAGRCYKCPCGIRVWSTFGKARMHSHICPQAWESGEVPEDHSDIRMKRYRCDCPLCGKNVSYTKDTHTYGGWSVIHTRRLKRHKDPVTGEWCKAHDWRPSEGKVTYWERGPRGQLGMHHIDVPKASAEDVDPL